MSNHRHDNIFDRIFCHVILRDLYNSPILHILTFNITFVLVIVIGLSFFQCYFFKQVSILFLHNKVAKKYLSSETSQSFTDRFVPDIRLEAMHID